MTKTECAANRQGCEKYRTLEHQNLVLQLRSWVKEEIEDFTVRMDRKFDAALKDLGYQEQTPADTAVPANPHDHPERRDEDVALRRRAISWVQKNGAWLLAVLLGIIAGSELAPFGKQIIQAFAGMLVRWMAP
jgi:hypothetical protein